MRRGTRERVFGPYPHGRAWRLIVVDPRGERHPVPFPTRERAEAYKALYEREIDRTEKTVDQAVDDYERYLIAKGNKPRSYRETVRRLRRFFPDLAANLEELTPRACKRYYEELAGRGLAADSHRNYLLEARSFLRWCVRQGWLARNPLEGLEGQGRRKHGGPQLRLDEARAWLVKAHQLARREPGAAAASLTLLMGLRASEVVGVAVRDVDDQGRMLWIAESKTEAGRRAVPIPPELRSLLLRLAGRRPGGELLFGKHWRDWPREWVQRICAAAGVPKMTAHGMRRTCATLAAARAIVTGSPLSQVAASLGHESFTTTATSYADKGALRDAARERGLRILKGGRKGR